MFRTNLEVLLLGKRHGLGRLLPHHVTKDIHVVVDDALETCLVVQV